MGTMRKSRYVSLLLAASALAACDQNTMTGQDETLYPDVAACAAERDPAECDAGFTAAKEEHLKQAPKFATKEECEAAGFQQCESPPAQTAQSGGGYFMPMMMGYMMGRMLGGGMGGGLGGMGQSGPAPGSPPGGATANSSGNTGANASTRPAARPVYGDRNGYLYAGGSAVGRVAPGTTSLGSRAIPMRTAARGGFGGSARGFSGGA